MGWNIQQLNDFAKQVIQAETKIKKRQLQPQMSNREHLRSEDSISAYRGPYHANRGDLSNRSDLDLNPKAGFSEYTAPHGLYEFDPLLDQGTPNQRDQICDDSQPLIRRQATESPFNSPFQLNSARPRLANTVIEEQAPISAINQTQNHFDNSQMNMMLPATLQQQTVGNPQPLDT